MKKNESEEDQAVPEDIADYYKGEAHIILEEFTLSLIDLPSVVGAYVYLPFLYAFKLTSKLSDSLCTFVEGIPLFQLGYVYQRKSIFTNILNINYQTVSSNFESVSSLM